MKERLNIIEQKTQKKYYSLMCIYYIIKLVSFFFNICRYNMKIMIKQSTLMLLIALANELFIITRKLDNIARIMYVFVARQLSRNYPFSTHSLISILLCEL